MRRKAEDAATASSMTSAHLVGCVAASMAFGVTWLLAPTALADNPVVQTNYTADPAPMVYGDKVYLYTTHDEDVTVNNFFTMNDWRVYSTADMANWTDHGSPLSYKSFSWAKGDAWAGQCIPRNGKFYFYVPITQKTGGGAIGVAVADSPTGPFTDALGKPLATTGTGDIDPTVFIDTDGQAYLYWGNPKLWYVKLNQDMITYPGKPTEVQLTTAGFGTRSNTDRATAYEEGPWFYKRGSLYYIVYPADGVPEKISYTTSTGALGPWTYRGDIMAKQSGAGSSFTNHPGIIDFADGSYFFYHNGALPGGGGFKRSVAVERFTYNADGTIPTLKMTSAGPPAVANLNPFVRTEAETIAFSSGLKTEACTEGGMNVTAISNGDYIKVKAVDFGTGAASFEARVASASSGGSIELRLGSASGTLVGTCSIAGTGGAQTWATRTCTVTGATGLHDLYLKFTGGSGDLFNFNWWRFIPKDPLPDAGAGDGAPRDALGDTGAGTGGTGGGSGTTGSGGAGGGSGGATASGGASGTQASGGTTGSGGRSTGGTTGSTSASGGASAGGTPGSGGRASSGGSTTSHGGSGTGGTSASGGVTGSGGATSPGPTGGTTSPPSTTGSGVGGCTCQNAPGGSNAYLAFASIALAALLRRRARGFRQ